jgi:iron complex outermembrane receptor protein
MGSSARTPGVAPASTRVGEPDLAARRTSTSDSARLLQDVPGVSLYGAGGISSLPAIHGLADDRLRVVDAWT